MNYILLFAVGFITISIWSVWSVTHQKTIESGLTPKDFKLAFENLTLTAGDNIPIAGWFIPAPDSGGKKPALVILHGYPAEKGDMLFIASGLHQSFNILLIDLRSFGKSGGSFTTLGNKERLDLSAGLDFLETRGFSKTGVLGFSLGGATAILKAASDERIVAVVSYASFADLTLLGRELYRTLPILRYPLVELMKFWGKLFWDVDADSSPAAAASHLTIPVMLVHTKQDEQIPFRHAEILRDALQNNQRTEFLFSETGRHGELPMDFTERVKNFFLKHLL